MGDAVEPRKEWIEENVEFSLEDDYKIKPDKITVIYNGLTDSKISVGKSALRQKYRIPDVPIFLFAGRLDNIKGLKYALRAFKIVLKAHPACRFIIAGNGDFDSLLVECDDIYMNVIWTGLINKEKLYELYTIADIGIMPSFHEQCSYVAIEMMMHGLPVVATSTSGLNEVVNNACGLKIPLTILSENVEVDVMLLSEKIIYLLQHPIEAKRMGQNGRKRYLDNYTSGIFCVKMVKTYNSLFQQ